MADPWASVTDVADLTGATVGSTAEAQAVIETLVGRTADSIIHISAKDLVWLKRAVAYQAAWMAGQPDLITRTEVSGSSQDGASAQYRPDAHILAPLARRALKRLSWRGNRSVRTGRMPISRPIDPAAHWVGGVFDEGHEQWIREEL